MYKTQVGSKSYDLGVQREFWNNWIANCLEERSPDPSTLRRGEVALAAVKSLSLSSPNILEVGCATGWLSTRLTRFGQVTGVDLANKPIEGAKTRCPHIHFIAGDFLALDLPAEHFDLVVTVDVISYFEDQRLFLDRIAGLLKSRGYLILMCPHKFIWDRTNFIRHSHGEIPLKWLDMRELKALLRDDFSIRHCETILPAGHRGILRLINSYRLNALIHRVMPEAHVLGLKEKMGLGKTLVVVAQKRK